MPTCPATFSRRAQLDNTGHAGKHLDAALAHVDASSLASAQSEYQAFDDGWFEIEDGIRDQSHDSYEAIEDAMADARRALRTDQIDPDQARAVPHVLRQQIDAFIRTQTPISTVESGDAPGT